jgi:hypothetical protein
MPSARTSAGNKEYEYEAGKSRGNKQRAASLQQAGNRHQTVSLGYAAVAVALRHVIDRKPCLCELSTVFYMKRNSMALAPIWTVMRPYGESR